VTAEGFALVVWISLVAADPLLDPWELAASKLGKIELTVSFERSENESWQLDDADLLNPFEPD
jgi:hypothetical protein